MSERLWGKEHNIFCNLTILLRLEELLKTEKKTFEELAVTNLLELLRHCTINERDLGSVMTCILPMNRREQVHRIFDVHTEKRLALEKMLKDTQAQQRRISHQTPLTGLTLNDVSLLTSQLEDLDVLISNLQTQLNAIPARNGISDSIFNSPSTSDLVSSKLIRVDGHSTFLTSRGEDVVFAAQNGFSQLRGLAERREKVEDQFLIELFSCIKKAMTKRLVL